MNLILYARLSLILSQMDNTYNDERRESGNYAGNSVEATKSRLIDRSLYPDRARAFIPSSSGFEIFLVSEYSVITAGGLNFSQPLTPHGVLHRRGSAFSVSLISSGMT